MAANTSDTSRADSSRQQDTSIEITVPSNHVMAALLGTNDQWLNAIEARYSETQIVTRGNEISITGEGKASVAILINELVDILQKGQQLDADMINRSMDMVIQKQRPSEVLTSEILRSARGNAVRPKSAGQKKYVEAIEKNIITFGIGPAGTGKSWLAVAMAVKALKEKRVERILLTRPAVEAGERLGFLPGDLMAKIDPYLRPLYDALYDMLDAEYVGSLIERGVIEVAPLAFMRGRTLNHSFIILDEAQNTTPQQMKMFLTRIGFGSKVVVTGDATQIDVPHGQSGLTRLEPKLRGISGLQFVLLGSKDVVRHRIVADIIDAYERSEENSDARPPAKNQRASQAKGHSEEER